MKTIDMNDFYVDPLLYGNPPQTEVSDEMAEALWQFMRDEQAADRRVRRAKAYYSLDCGDGIEYRRAYCLTNGVQFNAALGIAAYYTHYMCQPLKSAKALAIKSIGGEDIDGSSFCEFRVRPMVCFSKYSCTICSIKARSVC